MNIFQLILLVLVIMVAGMPGGWLVASGSFWSGVALSQLLGLGLPLVWISHIAHGPHAEWFPRERMTRNAIVVIVLATIGLTTAVDWTVALLQARWHFPLLFEQRHHAQIHAAGITAFGLRLLLLCVLPAIGEEFIFRGVILGNLLRYGERTAVMVSALLFGLAHWNLAYLPLYTLLGVYLGGLRVRSHNLLWPILAHAVNNAWTLYLH